MKPGRQTIILDIIRSQNVETQNQLLELLAERGIVTTQATLSRDIKDLRLIKETGPDGSTRYSLPAEPEDRTHNLRLQTILRESVLAADNAKNLIVIRTLPGLASGAGSALDGMEIDGLVGTIAGDDTIFLAMKSDAQAEAFLRTLREMLSVKH